MATSLLSAQYEFNGVVSTDKSVLKNLQDMCTACGSWLTYDIHEGLWAVVINRAGDSVASFDDSNIIGSIAVQGTGLDQLTDHCIVNFPHTDINDNRDFIRIDVADEDRFPNEISRPVTIETDLFNDPVQAQLLGLIELKQRRLDRVIRFTTDFSQIGLKAGDLIDVTNAVYGYTAKMFRIISINESDADNGTINLDITALEYNAAVYDTADLSRYTITNQTGIVSLGNISAPGTPSVTKYEFDARPRLVINSTAPTYGRVNGLEYWYSTDVPPDVTIDANRTYRLLATTYANANTVFTPGSTISTDQDSLGNISLLVKTRGINEQTAGPFSDPSGSVTFAPVQTTNAINDQTQVSNTGTGSLLTALALTELLKYVDGLFNSNTAVSQAGGGLFDKMFKVFKSNSSYDILGNAGNVRNITSNIASPNKVMVSALAGIQTYTGLATNTSFASMGSKTFTAPRTGGYKIDCKFDQNTSGAVGKRGTLSIDIDGTTSTINEGEDNISVGFNLYPTSDPTNILSTSSSGGVGAFYWTDFFATGKATLTNGVSYTLEFLYLNNTVAGGSASFDVGYDIYTIY